MVLDLLRRKEKKDVLGPAPDIPYRRHTNEEQKEFNDYARDSNLKDKGIEFWQQTTEEARDVLRTVVEGGFVVSEEFSFGGSAEGYGAISHIYPRNYQGKIIEGSCNHDEIIGYAKLWEWGGFFSNPISLNYRNPEIIDDTFELRDYLISSSISFSDSVDLDRIRREISDLKKTADGKLEILSRLEDIDLRE